MDITFDTLPTTVSDMKQQLDRIELLLKTTQFADTDQLLSIDQAAKKFHYSKPWFYAGVESGKLPHIKRGRRVLFLESDLMQFFKDGRRATTEEMREQAVTFYTSR